MNQERDVYVSQESILRPGIFLFYFSFSKLSCITYLLPSKQCFAKTEERIRKEWEKRQNPYPHGRSSIRIAMKNSVYHHQQLWLLKHKLEIKTEAVTKLKNLQNHPHCTEKINDLEIVQKFYLSKCKEVCA